MKSIRILFNLLIACVFALVIVSCDRTRNDKGYEYFPDMAHSLAFETYSPNAVFADSSTMRLPASNTIPREMIPYAFENTPEGRAKAAVSLVNPLEVNDENINQGKAMYDIFCSQCHGTAGDGNGYLFTSGRYAIKPASLLTEKMLAAPDADIFHVITAGYQVMAPHGDLIRPDDRWKIALFVKHELQNNPAK
ncbi:MAG: c-type cytochrome [Lentimicrobiaceae bacterium]|jgi:mono/diheme cytochrome c family protein|nr:c-type cytochrome [Lentimicrobiaceae bacterium]MDD4596991.1 c-type cytochrome [Lentimicrobiaceae bacterium]MDY0026705.1 c-type cytochrome [Lentimicrobium sp.]